MIPSSIIRNKSAQRRVDLFNSCDRLTIERYQVEQFNKAWFKALSSIPFYQRLKNEYSLPLGINTLQELSSFPVIKKQDVQEIFTEMDNIYHYSDTLKTGGSTGSILELPSSNSLRNFRASSMIMARKMMGIKNPNNNYLMFWGHAHLMGKGFHRVYNLLLRRIKDYCLGIYRINSYNMTQEKVSRFISLIMSNRWNFTVTYSSVCNLLLQGGLKETPSEHKLIITGDTPNFEILSKLKTSTSLSIGIEYGSAETGLISFTKDDSYVHNVVWDAVIAQMDNDQGLIITTISNVEEIPLIRYSIEDLVEVSSCDNTDSILTFQKVIGRKNDLLELNSVSGTRIMVYPEVWQHIFRKLEWIKQFSVHQISSREIIIYYVGDIAPGNADIVFTSYLSQSLQSQINISVEFSRVYQLKQTISGKHRFVIKDFSRDSI